MLRKENTLKIVKFLLHDRKKLHDKKNQNDYLSTFSTSLFEKKKEGNPQFQESLKVYLNWVKGIWYQSGKAH